MFRSTFALLAALLALPAIAAEDGSTPALQSLTYSGDQSALESLDRDIRAAGTDAGKLSALEKRLFDTLKRTDTTFAARQAICQRLGTIASQSSASGNADAYKRLGGLLADERDSDLARQVLEPVAGDATDALFTTALGKSTGRARIGIMGSLGRRRTVSAVAALAKLLADSDSKTALAAAHALGRIGGPAAIDALRNAPTAIADDAAAARLTAAERLPAGQALPILRDVQGDTRAGAPTRAAAFRVALALEPAGAPARIAETLGGSDASLKLVALEAIADLPGASAEVGRALTSRLGTWDASTQAAVLHALGRRRDAAVVPAALAALKHDSSEVRAAALTALSFAAGTKDIVAAFARTITGENTDDAKLARQGLARLNGPEVSAAILAGATTGEPRLRAAYLEQLALRNMMEGLPLLYQCRNDPDTAVRTAALAALGDLAPVSDQQKLIDWAVAAKDEAEQSRALRSVVSVALREPKVSERGRVVCAAIESAPADVAQRLLPALTRLGGESSAACAAKLAVRDNPKLAEAAADALSRWTDHTAIAALETVATKAAVPAVRASAVDAALKHLTRSREAWTEKNSKVVASLFTSTTDAGKRKQLVALLTRAKDSAALEFVSAQKSDPALGETARYTAAVVEANRAGPPGLRANPSSGTPRNMLDGKTNTRWSVTTNGEEWVEVDFKVSRPMRTLTLDQATRLTDFPERYEVYVTNDPKAPGAALVTGKGQRSKTVVDLPAGTQGRYLIIKNTQERAEGQWTITELVID